MVNKYTVYIAVVAVVVLAITGYMAYAGREAAESFYPTEAAGQKVEFNSYEEATQYINNFLRGVSDFLSSRLRAALSESNVRYLNRSKLRGTAVEHLLNRTVAVVEANGKTYAVALPQGVTNPTERFEVYDVETGRRVPSRTVVKSRVTGEYKVPIDQNTTIVINIRGIIYKINIDDQSQVQPLAVVTVYNYYGVTWYFGNQWATSVYAAGYFAIDMQTGVKDILPAGWLDTNYNIGLTVCYRDAPGKAYYSANYRYGAVQTVAVHSNFMCPGATWLYSYPWIGIDGVTGQWIYPNGIPADKSWSITNCQCNNVQTVYPPTFPGK
ncbi:hypothetical protein [Pyrobaculum ferrireducens]|uniref:Uncharacterized protein n=1 Tax=Pyrobaculum ferrireducens TaxID=1104324 RepID=G7VGA4_9CREN|nr:hypothetical protein [Pyrobaculum ferrireducens]AET31815.1 hypothetical protein P186_0361 [Pyrobaculum ferrireducens]